MFGASGSLQFKLTWQIEGLQKKKSKTVSDMSRQFTNYNNGKDFLVLVIRVPGGDTLKSGYINRKLDYTEHQQMFRVSEYSSPKMKETTRKMNE